MPTNVLRNIPSVTELLDSPPLRGLVERVNRNIVVSSVRSALDELRHELQSAAADRTLPSVSELAEKIAGRILGSDEPSLRPVINATGILLHTGLGRAPLAAAAAEALQAAAQDYTNLELDLRTGERSNRVDAVEGLLHELTGAEAAAVVNNNAGATLLTLAALAAGREVIVSRGQLIEIGGSFRLPDVMAASGAVLREVGTTNKTHLADYRNAIGESTAAIMKVHPSNFVVQGFAASVDLASLVRLGREHNLPVIDDIGSGALVDFGRFGCAGEPVAHDSIRQGADLVLFSGDKLLGGPQCGIIVGRRTLVNRIATHPMMRAFRVDKLTLAALAATLLLYRKEEVALREIPILQLLDTPRANLKHRAERLAPQLAACEVVRFAQVVEEEAQLGGGSLPTQKIPTYCVAVEPCEMNVDKLAAALRTGTPAVVGRVKQDRLLLDLRSVFPRQDAAIAAAVAAVNSTSRPTTIEAT